MIDSIFKKQEKISHRTPGYRIFQPIRIPDSTVVFKFWGWAWGCKKCRRAKQARCYCSFLFLAVVLLARLVVLCVLCYDVFFVPTAIAFFVLFFFVCKLLCMQFLLLFVCGRRFFACFDFCCSFVVLFVCFVCCCLFFALLLCLLCFVCFV